MHPRRQLWSRPPRSSKPGIRPRCDVGASAFEGIDHGGVGVRQHLVVRICESKILSVCRFDTAIARNRRPGIVTGDHGDSGITFRDLLRFRCGVVIGSIVDNENLEGNPFLSKDAVQALLDEVACIEGRDYNAEGRSLFLAVDSPSRSRTFRGLIRIFGLLSEVSQSFNSTVAQMPQGLTPLLCAHSCSPPFSFICSRMPSTIDR